MDLVLLVCLAATPSTCREERLTIAFEQTDPRTCMAGAVPVIAEWTGDHPDWQVARWKCGSTASLITRNFN
jgi:hypothetical protein